MVEIITVIITALIVFFVYRQGLKDGKQMQDGQSLKPIIMQKAKQTKEQIKSMAMINNLNRYDGTGEGQVKI